MSPTLAAPRLPEIVARDPAADTDVRSALSRTAGAAAGRRRFVLGTAAAPLALSLTPLLGACAHADTPPVVQVSGVRHVAVGDAVLTALLDGFVPLDLALFSELSAAEAAELLEASFLAPGPITVGVNAYVLRDGARTVLIDTGGANAMPGLGHLGPALEAAGIAPASVDTVLLTHLHPDHIGGLLDANGAVFADAELVVHEADLRFWTDAAIAAQAPESARPFFELAATVVAAHEGRIRTFGADAEVLPSITSRHLPGHTPGHSGYRIEAAEQSILIWGDIVLAAPLQLPRPEIGSGFDVDVAAAATTRRALLDEVARGRDRIAGMHLDFPGIGHVARDGQGYRFAAEPWRRL